MTTSAAGGIAWSRSKYRIAEGKTLRFAMDLVAHAADWRAGLGWMVRRYPDYFNPPNSKADQMAGCGAYSADQRHIDAAKLRRMAFRINWLCSEDFPYMGMFLPPLADQNATWRRATDEPPIPGKSEFNSFKSLNDYSRFMRENGFYALNYFNVTEFGRNMRWPPRRAWPPRRKTSGKTPTIILYAKCPDAVLLATGAPHHHLRQRDLRGRPGRSGVSKVHVGAGPAAHRQTPRLRGNLHRPHGLVANYNRAATTA